MALSAAEALELLAAAARVANELSTLVPQLEANAAAIKQALASTNDAALSVQIEQLHADSIALTRQVTALRD